MLRILNMIVTKRFVYVSILILLFSYSFVFDVGVPPGVALADENMLTDNVGIGTTGIEAKLQIKASGTTSGFTVRIQDSEGADKMSILDVGNIGIGTTDPGSTLEVVGSLKIPSGAAPTVVSEGELAWETDDDHLHMYDGSNDIVLAGKTKSISFIIKSPEAADDFILWQTPRHLTITAVSAKCSDGINVIGQLQEYDSAGANPADVDSDWTVTTSEYTDVSFTNASIDAGDWLGWKTTSVSGTVNFISLTVEYYET
jgi:hypothetical protein